MTNDELKGLDLRETIEFYRRNQKEILEGLPADLTAPDIEYVLDSPEHMALTSPQINGLIGLFPRQARERSVLSVIMGIPTLYFRKDYPANGKVTHEKELAFSDTAIVPSYIANEPEGLIGLFNLPETAIPEPLVRRIIHSEGLVHELAHSLTRKAKQGTEQLQLPNGRVINSRDYVLGLRSLLEKYKPISAYSSVFRKSNGTFKDENEQELFSCIDEELAETIAAYFLGFSFCHNDSRGLNPFADRAELKNTIQEYLTARRVK